MRRVMHILGERRGGAFVTIVMGYYPPGLNLLHQMRLACISPLQCICRGWVLNHPAGYNDPQLGVIYQPGHGNLPF